jgi:hypothetical protein
VSTMHPWLREIIECVHAGASTGDLSTDEAVRLVEGWAGRLAL